MKRRGFFSAAVIAITLLFLFSGCDNQPQPLDGQQQVPSPGDSSGGSIENSDYLIADHTIVDDYNKIPQTYIDIVKSWLVDAAGESHSAAYRTGVELLASIDNRFAASVFTSGCPDAASPQGLRLGRHGSVGEEDFWTNESAIDTIKSLVQNQHDTGNPINVILQAWCWDFTRSPGPAAGGSNGYDPEYGCRWFGSTSGGPDGNFIWGLDDEDKTLTGNSLSLKDYLNAIDNYNQFFAESGYIAKAVFSTGPVDGGSSVGETGYQRFIKHEAIRDYVKTGNGRILFDYADILAYNDNGDRCMVDWTSPANDITYPFPSIHSDNDGEETGHIGETGALRLGKAMWWLLARMAGWDGQ